MATMPWNEQDRLNLLSAIGKPAMAPMQQVGPAASMGGFIPPYPAGSQGQITPATARQPMPAAAAPAAKKGMWDSFLGGALADPDKRARIAMALEGMTLNPNQALIDNLKSGVERRAGTASRNKTVEWLRSQGREDLANAVESGSITGSDAANILFTAPKDDRTALQKNYEYARSQGREDLANAVESGSVDGKTAAGIALTPKGSNIEYKEFNGKLYSIDKTTGKLSEVTGTGMGEKEREAISKARTEFTALPPVKEFNLITSAYGRIITSAKEPTAAGDLALIFNYMKMLDPGSTVREGEFANAQNAGGVDTRARSLYNNIREGTRLTAGQRDDFAKRATMLYSQAEEGYNSLAGQFGKFATSAGLPADQVIPKFGYAGERYKTPLVFRKPAAPTGVDQTSWDRAWASMSDDERREFLGE